MRKATLALKLILICTLLGGCALPGRYWVTEEGSLRLSALAGEGDAARRASTGLVLDGLDAEIQGFPSRAMGLYEQALRVDSLNPNAYLAMARFFSEGEHPERALHFLDQAESLLMAQEERPAGMTALLAGLRGSAYRASGMEAEAAPLLEQARRLAPQVWSDGILSPEELR